jgi:hypothetical protein
MPTSRARTAGLIAAAGGGLLFLAWFLRVEILPAVFADAAGLAAPGTTPVTSRPQSAARPAAAPGRASAPASGTPFTADICGVGKVALVEKPQDDSDDGTMLVAHLDDAGNIVEEPQSKPTDPDAVLPRDEAIDEWVVRRTEETYDDTLSAMKRSGDARLLTLATTLGDHGPTRDATMGSQPHQFVALASTTSDPVVYAIAYEGCRALSIPDALVSHSPGCESMDVHRWATLDPQNAVPWLVAALEADVAGDQAAVAYAMHHAAEARTYDTYSMALTRSVDRVIPGDPDSLEHTALEAELIPTVASGRRFSLAPLLRYCGRRTIDLEGRRQDCQAIGGLLVNGATFASELVTAMHVLQVAEPGDPALDPLRDARARLMIQGHLPGVHWTCRYREQQQKYIQDYLFRGEMAARFKVLEQLDPAPPGPSQKDIDREDLYLDREEVMPLLMSDPGQYP